MIDSSGIRLGGVESREVVKGKVVSSGRKTPSAGSGKGQPTWGCGWGNVDRDGVV